MIPAWLQRLLNICKKQPDHQDKPPAPKNNHNNQKAPDYRNTQSTIPRDDGIFYTGFVVGGIGAQQSAGSQYLGNDGGGGGCPDGGGSGGDGGCASGGDGGGAGCGGNGGGGCSDGGCGGCGGCGGD